jgi:hypothetical protein
MMRLRSCVAPALLLLASAGALSAQSPFIRGDSNVDGGVNISDPLKTFGVLFVGDPNPGCDDAMDANDNGSVDISDGLYSLNFLFSDGPALPPPAGACGPDATDDALGCAAYGLCAAPCLDQALIDSTIAEQVPPGACVPEDAAVVTQGQFIVTVCPAAGAGPCPGAADPPGCLISITEVTGVLDLAGSKVDLHVDGIADGFPIHIEETQFGGTATCLVDITFTGDAAVPFVLGPAEGGGQMVVDVGAPTFADDVAIGVSTSSPGVICALLVAAQDQFKPQIIDQLEVAAAELIAGFEAEIVGMKVCAE